MVDLRKVAQLFATYTEAELSGTATQPVALVRWHHIEIPVDYESSPVPVCQWTLQCGKPLVEVLRRQ